MRFQTPLVPATLIRRYKRFLADVTLQDGREVTAHCANPGSMLGLAEPGMQVWVEPNDDPKKKLKFGLRLVEAKPGVLVGVDTSLPNRLLKAAFAERAVPGFENYPDVRSEVSYGEGSRVDFLLSQVGAPDVYVEVKSVTLSREAGIAEFPDSVTKRGTKHLDELAAMAQAGHRAVLLYIVQRQDCARVRLAKDIDPSYADAFRAARDAGVETLALSCDLSPEDVSLAGSLAVE